MAGTESEEAARTPRERYREQVREEVKEHAREQIAAAGASALSLNAIAKRMSMTGPALYRYFANRDELITALIRDAYRSLADAVRAAAESGGGADAAGMARTLRSWALADPQRYFLVYGTPVPGYHAPEDITAIAREVMDVLVGAFDGAPSPGPEDGAAREFEAHLEGHRGWAPDDAVPTPVLHRALVFWTRVHGVLSLELAGHFTGMGFDPALLFAAEVDSLLR